MHMQSYSWPFRELWQQQALSPDIERSRRKTIVQQLTERELSDIQYWLRDVELDYELPNVCQTYTRLMKCTDYDMAVVYCTHLYRRTCTSRRQSLTACLLAPGPGPVSCLPTCASGHSNSVCSRLPVVFCLPSPPPAAYLPACQGIFH